MDPVYKPTPISLLEKRSEVSLYDKSNIKEIFNRNEFIESVIPVYQPTPISELEKYAPMTLPNCRVGSSEKIVFPSQPTYSPIVKSKCDLPSPSVFNYQPSPVYKTKQGAPVSVNINEVMELNCDSDGEYESVSNVQNSQEIFKPDAKSSKSSTTIPTNSKKEELKFQTRSSLKTPFKWTKEDDLPDLKRHKLFSLYEDLYGKSKAKTKSNVLTKINKDEKVRSINPYVCPDNQKISHVKSITDISNVNKIIFRGFL